MQPEVLVGVAADDLFQGCCVTLGQQAGIVGGALPFLGVDQLGAADFVAEPRADPPRLADDHRRVVLDGQQGDRLVRRGGPAEKLDE